MIAALAERKPVVAYTNHQMASAAYWLASQASEIFAERSADIGSIGVYLSLLDESGRFANDRIRREVFKTGRFKGMGLRGTELSSDQRQLLQARVDEIFGWFREAVTEGRAGAVPASAMEGQSFYAEEAKTNGLIDAVGSLADAEAELKALIARGA
jgi:ClpP class serine protease